MFAETDATIEQIFDVKRFPRNLYLLPILFYFPLGLTLATLRFFIGIHTFLIAQILAKLPSLRCRVLRVMCTILGFVVMQEDIKNAASDVHVIVSNHVTNFDHLAINLVKKCTVPSVWDLPFILNWILGYTNFHVTEGRQMFIENVKKYLKENASPVLAFPEGATTNGKIALLKFGVWPFSLGQPVNPVVIRLHQPPLIKVAASVLGSRWWSDMFWFLFVPYTVFHITYLPQMQKSEEETTLEFNSRVQLLMCQKLQLQASNLTSLRKVEYAKKLLEKTQ